MAAVPSHPSRARLLGPVIAAGVIAACAWALVAASKRPTTAGEAIDEIAEIALHAPRRAGGEAGGLIGPWWIAATDRGDEPGTLRNLRITTEDGLEIAARGARIEVDAADDALTFLLEEVVLTRVPDAEGADGPAEVLTLPSYRLGPIPLGRDIVASARSDALDD